MPTSTASAAGAPPGTSLTVMTRNVYIGTDINRLVLATGAAQGQGKSPQEVLVALANATHEGRAVVDRTDFTRRAPLLAAEMARTRPDLVGLQEVALWRSGPLELEAAGVPNATHVDYDFLRILLDALAAKGLAYRAVQVGTRADVEAPSFTGSPFDDTIGADARDVRLTVRDVILVRASTSLRVTDEGDAIFQHNLDLPLLGTTMRFDRGYHWVDVTAGATSVRFVNSHLEAFSADTALAQARELLAAVPAEDRTTVLVCDCNTDPSDSATTPGEAVPHNAPYGLITGPGGFADEWLQWAPAESGWTSGLSELVDDPTSAALDQRMDLVLVRAPGGGGLPVDRGQVTGTAVTDRDPLTGLWPSDHGGVVLRLQGL